MRALDASELVTFAEDIGIHLTTEHAKIYGEAMQILEEGMAQFRASEEDRPPLRETVRDPGRRPTTGEDPFNCFITRCLVKGSGTGPLTGKSAGLKDNISVAGVPMTVGSHFMQGFIANIDAPVVTRLLDAGADIVGKLNMDDFSRTAHGFGTGLGDFGRCLNPCAPEHLSGSSSSGSAVAVASGAVDLAIGGDQGGSIRIPAAWCGVVGLKPTHGLVPYTGVVGLDPILDHIGPIARTVEEVAVVLQCIAGRDGFDPRQADSPMPALYTEFIGKGIERLRIGVLQEGFSDDTEPDIVAEVKHAIAVLGNAGAVIEEVSVPQHLACGNLVPAFAWIGNALSIKTYGGALLQGYHDTHYTEVFGRFLASDVDLLPPTVKLSMLFEALNKQHALVYYGRAQNLRRTYQRIYDDLFRHVDCVIMPTTPMKAPRYAAPKDYSEALYRTLVRRVYGTASRNTAPFNITGHPALTVPCGAPNGLPIGLMIAGPRFSEGLLLQVAHTFERSVNRGRG